MAVVCGNSYLVREWIKGIWDKLANSVIGMRAASVITPESSKQGSAGSGGIRRVTAKRDPARQSSNSPMAKSSWETYSSALSSNMVYAGKRRPTFSQVPEMKRIEFHEVVEAKPPV